jgi:hypothetical protein
MTTFVEKVLERAWPMTRYMLVSFAALSRTIGGSEDCATSIVQVVKEPTSTLANEVATIASSTLLPTTGRVLRIIGSNGLFYGITGFVAIELTAHLWCGMQAAIMPIGTPAPEPVSVANMVYTYLFGNISRLIRGSSGLATLHQMLRHMEDGEEHQAVELQLKSNNNATRSMYRATKWALALNAVYPRLGRVRSAAEDMVIAIHVNKLFTNGYDDFDQDGNVLKGSGPVRLIDRYKLQSKVVEIYWQMGRDLSAEELRDGRVDFDMSGRPVSGALTAMWDYYIRGKVPTRQA